MRRLVRENELSVNDLIYPIFVVEGSNSRQPIESMPGIDRLSIDELEREVEHLSDIKLPAIALFPYIEPGLKDERGTSP